MKYVTLIPGCIFLTSFAFSQVVVVHSYDAAGNRIQRVQPPDNPEKPVVIRSFSTLQNQKTSSAVLPGTANSVKDTTGSNKSARITVPVFSDNTISLFPIPTTNILNICLNEDYMKRTDKMLYLYNLQGQILTELAIECLNPTIDLSAYLPGTYVLKLMASGFKQEFNVVKQ